MADGSLPNILQEVDIEMISDEICHTTKNTEMLTVSLTTPSDWLPVLEAMTTPSSDWRRMYKPFKIRFRCEREVIKYFIIILFWVSIFKICIYIPLKF